MIIIHLMMSRTDLTVAAKGALRGLGYCTVCVKYRTVSGEKKLYYFTHIYLCVHGMPVARTHSHALSGVTLRLR